jgi:uncharacterized protein (TIGR01370 family)
MHRHLEPQPTSRNLFADQAFFHEDTPLLRRLTAPLILSYLLSAILICAGCGGGTSSAPPPPPPATAVLKAAVGTQGNFSSGEVNASYTINVSNTGSGATSGAVTVADPPTGFTVTAISGTGWTCTLASATCTRSDSLAAGASFPAITVTGNVTSANGTPVTIPVTVSGGGTSSPVTVMPTPTVTVAAPMLSITKSHSGNFNSGQQGAAYTVTVANGASAGASNGKVTVTETVPSGEALVSVSGSGWTCPGAGGANTCDRSDSLASGGTYPAITVTVNVASSASSPQVNQVSVSGGGMTSPVSTTDSTAINLLPTVSFSANPSSITLGSSATLSWSSTNAASCTASGAWSGTIATSGTQTVTPTTGGSNTYTLFCQNSVGATASASSVITVAFAVGGTVSGLASGQGLVLDINGGSPQTLTANGNFTFISTLAPGENYTVWIGAQPNLQQCTVANQNGTLSNANVSNVNVACNNISTPSGPFAKVQSFEFLQGTGLTTPGIYSEVANSSADMIFLGGGFIDGALNRTAADPTGSKLIFGYLDVAEASAQLYPNLFSPGPVPTWFGQPNVAFTNLYSVQYWNPAWQAILYSNIDQIIANGYDGVFLDGLLGDQEWEAGNYLGNPVYADATQAMAQLLTSIRNYVSTKYPSQKFYLIGNNPITLAMQYPATLNSLDLISNETLYWLGSKAPGMGLITSYQGITAATFTMNVIAPIYKSSGVPVIGNDYPNPTSNSPAVFSSFDFYNSLGWVSSVQNGTVNNTILSTGPFLFTATPANPSVTGTPNFVNFITGGSAPNATLVGGNQGDYFIGGPGQNTITAGPGVNTIYAHPRSAGDKNKLVIDLSSLITGTATTPSASISVNGKVVVPSTPITAVYLTSTQEFVIDTTNMTPITSVIITGSNAAYVDANNNSSCWLMNISYNGQPIVLSSGVYAGGSGSGYAAYFLSNGTATFAGSLFPVNAPFLFDTSDVINGGSGSNTVIYRGPYSNYTVVKQANGSYLVTSQLTAEGPDTLTNIQTLQFSDQSITLN